jgi:hypothetical protein
MALERGRAGSAAREEGAPAELSVCVVGAGPRFLSGISYYTNRLVNALAARHRVSTLLIRQMLPTRLYPGRDRVGKSLTNFTYPVGSPVFDGIDWYWGLTLVRALGFLRRQRPEVVVLQWWTGTVLHTYLALAIAARLLRAKVVIEFHEVLDTAELNIAPVRWYVTSCAPWLLALSHGYVVHNEFDRAALAAHYHLGERPTKIIPHGPYNQ